LERLRFSTSHLLLTSCLPPWRKRWEDNHQPDEARAAAVEGKRFRPVSQRITALNTITDGPSPNVHGSGILTV
jgi:hypothetical protein